MFKKKYRLNPRIRLENTSRIQTVFFTLTLAKNQCTHNRYGFIASKRIDKRAVVRNRVKRRVRAAVEQMVSNVKNGYDMLFVLKVAAVGARTDFLYKEIERIFKKEKLLLV